MAREMAAGHFAGQFSAICGSGSISHSCSRPTKSQCMQWSCNSRNNSSRLQGISFQHSISLELPTDKPTAFPKVGDENSTRTFVFSNFSGTARTKRVSTKRVSMIGKNLKIYTGIYIYIFFSLWGPKLEYKLFGQLWDIPAKNPGISRQKNLISLVSRDIPKLFGPAPSCGRPLPHRKYLDSKVLVCAPFLRLTKKHFSLWKSQEGCGCFQDISRGSQGNEAPKRA